MTLLPLPPSVASALGSPGTSRSLAFDRGFDRWDRDARTGDWKIRKVPEGRQDFLDTFGNGFQRPPDYEPRLARRQTVLDTLGAHTVLARTAAPLVIGLGLAHPTETGLLLDRLTGCPYLPATSVKGLLRAAARWAARGELSVPGEDAEAFWAAHRDRLFGPAIVPGATAGKGELILYDAFPELWPRLELDVLTPHYQPYYSDASSREPPADWHDPTPVPFLTVAAEIPFLFAFSARNTETREDDLDRVEHLLRAALEQLGLGGKTAAGYGLFHATKGPGGTSQAIERTVWHGATVSWDPGGGGELIAYMQDETLARCLGESARELLDQLPEAARIRVTGKVPGSRKSKKRKPLVCDVAVVQHSEEWFELVGIEEPTS